MRATHQSLDPSGRPSNKKKVLKINSSNNSPVPIELIGADGLRSSKNKNYDKSVRSGYMPTNESNSPR